MLHGNSLQATHNHGSLPIDGIFAPAAIIPFCQVGYLAFGNGVPSNYQVIWLDILAGLLHLIPEATLAKAPAQRL